MTEFDKRIGRHSENDIVIEDPTVSRYHARLVKKGGNYYIENLEGRNGVYVNGLRISQLTKLDDYDIVKIGSYLFNWRLYIHETSSSVNTGEYTIEDDESPNGQGEHHYNPIPFSPPLKRKEDFTVFYILGVGIILVVGLIVYFKWNQNSKSDNRQEKTIIKEDATKEEIPTSVVEEPESKSRKLSMIKEKVLENGILKLIDFSENNETCTLYFKFFSREGTSVCIDQNTYLLDNFGERYALIEKRNIEYCSSEPNSMSNEINFELTFDLLKLDVFEFNFIEEVENGSFTILNIELAN
jgi:pSer/pThr/pTyr-binding forkhead associated (FHA) protein